MGTTTPTMRTFILLALVLTIAVQLAEQQPRRRRRGVAADLDQQVQERSEVTEVEKSQDAENEMDRRWSPRGVAAEDEMDRSHHGRHRRPRVADEDEMDRRRRRRGVAAEDEMDRRAHHRRHRRRD